MNRRNKNNRTQYDQPTEKDKPSSGPRMYYQEKNSWYWFTTIISCCLPVSCLTSACPSKFSTPDIARAWKDKVALCVIIVFASAILFFLTVVLRELLCPQRLLTGVLFSSLKSSNNTFAVGGGTYSYRDPTLLAALRKEYNTKYEFSAFLSRDLSSCKKLPEQYGFANYQPPCGNSCKDINVFTHDTISNGTFLIDFVEDKDIPVGFGIVMHSKVLDISPFLTFLNLSKDVSTWSKSNNAIIKAILPDVKKNKSFPNKMSFTDISKAMSNRMDLLVAKTCLEKAFLVGRIPRDTGTCIVYDVINYFFLLVVLIILGCKYGMALLFSWVVAPKLAKPPSKNTAVMIPGPEDNVDCYHPTGLEVSRAGEKFNEKENAAGLPYVVMLVTAYTEDEQALKVTLDSMTDTTYPSSRKCFMIIADGLMRGGDSPETTPEIILRLLELDPNWADPKPFMYHAVAEGELEMNQAKVYVGHYISPTSSRVPVICVVKCGMPKEKKLGNRGKRDSQMILMNFFSRCLLNERICPLEYDLFRKIHYLMGVTPDCFEAVLMVDADTMVLPDSLSILCNAIMNDDQIMGLCGETRIANKRQSWVTQIQVYEYFIAHHLGKTFEAMFGGVTCLPGCFSMYRLKAPGNKPNTWTPILCSPDVLEEYSKSDIVTLHEKNLFHLGEDRFLSTLMIRTFPKRKMMFVPQAKCKTTVPDTFSNLLSQRRRWINSTVHNLLELVFVHNLCGTFCFSMQFVVLMDIIGTVTLPLGIFLFYYLLFGLSRAKYQSFADYIPLMLVLLLFLLPPILILLATRKVVYCMWMLVYLLALPIWNFVLPVYSYWHFDDFKWGNREAKESNSHEEHSQNDSQSHDGSILTLQRWEKYELAFRRSALKRQQKAQQENYRFFPQDQTQQYAHSPYSEGYDGRPPNHYDLPNNHQHGYDRFDGYERNRDDRYYIDDHRR